MLTVPFCPFGMENINYYKSFLKNWKGKLFCFSSVPLVLFMLLTREHLTSRIAILIYLVKEGYVNDSCRQNRWKLYKINLSLTICSQKLDEVYDDSKSWHEKEGMILAWYNVTNPMAVDLILLIVSAHPAERKYFWDLGIMKLVAMYFFPRLKSH